MVFPHPVAWALVWILILILIENLIPHLDPQCQSLHHDDSVMMVAVTVTWHETMHLTWHETMLLLTVTRRPPQALHHFQWSSIDLQLLPWKCCPGTVALMHSPLLAKINLSLVNNELLANNLGRMHQGNNSRATVPEILKFLTWINESFKFLKWFKWN